MPTVTCEGTTADTEHNLETGPNESTQQQDNRVEVPDLLDADLQQAAVQMKRGSEIFDALQSQIIPQGASASIDEPTTGLDTGDAVAGQQVLNPDEARDIINRINGVAALQNSTPEELLDAALRGEFEGVEEAGQRILDLFQDPPLMPERDPQPGGFPPIPMPGFGAEQGNIDNLRGIGEELINIGGSLGDLLTEDNYALRLAAQARIIRSVDEVNRRATSIAGNLVGEARERWSRRGEAPGAE